MKTSENAAFPKFQEIGSKSWHELEALILKGEAPDAGSLAGWEYRGMNIAPLVKYLGLQKFVKGFFRKADGRLMGYNIAVRQDGLEAPWVARTFSAPAKKFGFFRVCKADTTVTGKRYLNTLLLDYGQGGNGSRNITALIRDYLVRVEKDSDELLLGKAYMAIGRNRIMLSYFVLERLRPTG